MRKSTIIDSNSPEIVKLLKEWLIELGYVYNFTYPEDPLNPGEFCYCRDRSIRIRLRDNMSKVYITQDGHNKLCVGWYTDAPINDQIFDLYESGALNCLRDRFGL